MVVEEEEEEPMQHPETRLVVEGQLEAVLAATQSFSSSNRDQLLDYQLRVMRLQLVLPLMKAFQMRTGYHQDRIYKSQMDNACFLA